MFTCIREFAYWTPWYTGADGLVSIMESGAAVTKLWDDRQLTSNIHYFVLNAYIPSYIWKKWPSVENLKYYHHSLMVWLSTITCIYTLQQSFNGKYSVHINRISMHGHAGWTIQCPNTLVCQISLYTTSAIKCLLF